MYKLNLVLVTCLIHCLCANNGLADGKTISKREVKYYTTKYDNIDINHVVASKRLMKNYANCLLEKGPCSPEGKELRTYLPDAMQTDCAKCSVRQKEISGIVLAHLLNNYPDLWNQLLIKYDPEGTFRKKVEGGDDDEEEEEDEEDE